MNKTAGRNAAAFRLLASFPPSLPLQQKTDEDMKFHPTSELGQEIHPTFAASYVGSRHLVSHHNLLPPPIGVFSPVQTDDPALLFSVFLPPLHPVAAAGSVADCVSPH